MQVSDQLDHLKKLFQESIAVKQRVIDSHLAVIVEMAEVITDSLRQGGKILFCGNGGSAADAQHLAAELLIRLRSEVDRDGLAALALATDTSSLTACGNDYAFAHYYERQVRTLGKKGDVLVAISTSGNSENIVRALRAAREIKVTTLGLLGNDGGQALSQCDQALVVPSNITGRIQETHITAGHAMVELVEEKLLAEK